MSGYLHGVLPPEFWRKFLVLKKFSEGSWSCFHFKGGVHIGDLHLLSILYTCSFFSQFSKII